MRKIISILLLMSLSLSLLACEALDDFYETLPATAEQTTPTESTPDVTIPEGTTPVATTPEETTPTETTPAETIPTETTPAETTPAETTPAVTEPDLENDPSNPYDAVTYVTLKELRTNCEAYEGVKVAVEGIVSQDSNGTLYLEQYDEEDGRYYGMQVYYGYNLVASAKRFLKAGNLVYIVGTFQYAEVVNAYQIAGLEYDQMKPDDPAYTHKIAEGQTVPYTEIQDLKDFVNGKTNMTVGDETIAFANDELALYTSATITGLKVVDWYVTKTGDNAGAISLTCEKDGVRFTVRTIVLRENGQVVTPDRFIGKTIDVKGVIDSYTQEGHTEAQIQLRVFFLNNITIH